VVLLLLKKISSDRTSDTSYLCFGNCQGMAGGKLDQFFKRIQFLTGCDWQQQEIMAVRYQIGQQYKAHYDFLEEEFLYDDGQRMVTIFIYLNSLNEDQGGNTSFPNIGLSVRPKKKEVEFIGEILMKMDSLTTQDILVIQFCMEKNLD